MQRKKERVKETRRKITHELILCQPGLHSKCQARLSYITRQEKERKKRKRGKTYKRRVVVVHTQHWGSRGRRSSVSLWPACSTDRVLGQPGLLHTETVARKKGGGGKRERGWETTEGGRSDEGGGERNLERGREEGGEERRQRVGRKGRGKERNVIVRRGRKETKDRNREDKVMEEKRKSGWMGKEKKQKKWKYRNKTEMESEREKRKVKYKMKRRSKKDKRKKRKRRRNKDRNRITWKWKKGRRGQSIPILIT